MSDSWSEQDARDFFAEVFRGAHHIPGKLKAYGSGWTIACNVSLSTWDDSFLTRLVLYAHERAVRVEIQSCNFQRMRVSAWKRAPLESAGGQPLMTGHPSIEQALALFRGKPLRELIAESHGE